MMSELGMRRKFDYERIERQRKLHDLRRAVLWGLVIIAAFVWWLW